MEQTTRTSWAGHARSPAGVPASRRKQTRCRRLKLPLTSSSCSTQKPSQFNWQPKQPASASQPASCCVPRAQFRLHSPRHRRLQRRRRRRRPRRPPRPAPRINNNSEHAACKSLCYGGLPGAGAGLFGIADPGPTSPSSPSSSSSSSSSCTQPSTTSGVSGGRERAGCW